MAQSKELTAFYKAYVKWLDKGAPDGQPFWRDSGLCYSALHYNGIFNGRAVDREMQQQFVDANLNEFYPFGGEDQFTRETDDDTIYQNEQRIAWVREHAETDA